MVLFTLPVGVTAGVGSVQTGGTPQSHVTSDVTSACPACAVISVATSSSRTWPPIVCATASGRKGEKRLIFMEVHLSGALFAIAFNVTPLQSNAEQPVNALLAVYYTFDRLCYKHVTFFFILNMTHLMFICG